MMNLHAASADRVFLPISDGVEISFLRRHEGAGATFLIRMAKGARAPRHDHAGGEETYLLRGRLRICARLDAAGAPVPDLVLAEGEYGFAPPGETHEGIAEEDALFLVVAPGGVSRATAAHRP
jgi:quercetin dioxygenase-like cupin family protein